MITVRYWCDTAAGEVVARLTAAICLVQGSVCLVLCVFILCVLAETEV